jgi:hypothetical protein
VPPRFAERFTKSNVEDSPHCLENRTYSPLAGRAIKLTPGLTSVSNRLHSPVHEEKTLGRSACVQRSLRSLPRSTFHRGVRHSDEGSLRLLVAPLSKARDSAVATHPTHSRLTVALHSDCTFAAQWRSPVVGLALFVCLTPNVRQSMSEPVKPRKPIVEAAAVGSIRQQLDADRAARLKKRKAAAGSEGSLSTAGSEKASK